ncbi:serine acetyltransferase [Nitzschia inconspicua]|uniref:serine O-acetyltransferase n=1 Tax=Nitzschia inconspicua TaxID=303405 RepID=A0A9K3L7R4_9STRA|nr:serine acetyltransferase [Nitzschia inconspicua]
MIAAESRPEARPPSSSQATCASANGISNGDTLIRDDDDYYHRLRKEALRVIRDEPEMERLLRRTVLAPHVASFEDAVIQTLCHRLLLPSASPLNQDANNSNEDESVNDDRYPVSPQGLRKLVHLCMDSDMEEKGWTFAEAIRKDAMAVVERDPAMESILEVVLFAKGYMALCCHRVAYRLWHMKRKYGALFMQSQTSAVFGVDIHPCATIGKGVMMDHATGIVVGETATIGDGCTILHGVTLGGTGKESGDRHPKVGEHVLIGAGSLLLGNITVGNSAKIGAGSVLLRDIPAFATAVGVPAKIIGRTDESDPADDVDNMLHHVSLLGRKPSTIITSTSTTSMSSAMEDGSSLESGTNLEHYRHGMDHENHGTHHRKMPHFVGRREFQNPPRMSDGDEFCPFREYTEVAQRGTPKGTVNIITLAMVLQEEGVPQCTLGLCFFEMDKEGRGYISMDTFLKDGPVVITRNCGFPIEKSTSLVQAAAALVEA